MNNTSVCSLTVLRVERPPILFRYLYARTDISLKRYGLCWSEVRTRAIDTGTQCPLDRIKLGRVKFIIFLLLCFTAASYFK